MQNKKENVMNKKELNKLLMELDIVENSSTIRTELDTLKNEDINLSKDKNMNHLENSDLTDDDIKIALLARLTRDIQSIKNMVTYISIICVFYLIITLFFRY